MANQTKLYFEAHVTVRPHKVAPELWETFVKRAEYNNMRASRFDVDEVDHYDGAWFLSARDTDYNKLFELIRGCKESLEALGYEFIRAKIEDTLFDTKHGDVL